MPTDATKSPIRLYSPQVFNARSRARFSRNRSAALMRHIGHEPSVPERIILSRIVALEWELLRLDCRIESGEELSAHALRARLAAENRLRLDLHAVGLKGPAQRALTPDEALAAAKAAARPNL